MKTFLLGLGLFLGMVLTCGTPVQGAALGLEAGANFSNISGSDSGNFIDSRIGFAGGGFLNLGLTPGIAFQPEVLYTQKGGARGTTIYEVDYIEVPLLLEFSLGTPEVNPGILLGPSFSANVVQTLLDNVNSSEVGIIGGTQVEIKNLFISGRYELGLTNITSNRNIQNGTFTFLVGISFI